MASHVAWGEAPAAAIEVFDKAVAAHGVPQRLLSDNGAALNPSRRGILGQLVVHVMALGVEPITGKPYKPTTQGKNERFHQTLFRYLDQQQPLPRPSPSCRPRSRRSTTSTTLNGPTKDCPAAPPGVPGTPPRRPRHLAPPAADLPAHRASPGTHISSRSLGRWSGPRYRGQDLTSAGVLRVDEVFYKVGARHGFQQVLVIAEGDQITITDLHGQIVIEHIRPTPGTTYVGNGQPRGPHRLDHPEPSPKS